MSDKTTFRARLRDGITQDVTGYRVNFGANHPAAGWDWIVHRPVDVEGWVVSERETGFNIGRYAPTRVAAVTVAQEFLGRIGREKIKFAVDRALARINGLPEPKAPKRERKARAPAKRTPNPFGKSRQITEPYATFRAGDWEWKVLKIYKSPAATLADHYARALCAVSSPMTHGGFDLGDVYAREIPGFHYWLKERINHE